MQFDINRIAEMISEFHSHAFMLTSFCDFKWKEDENKFEREHKEWIIAQLSLVYIKVIENLEEKKIKAIKCKIWKQSKAFSLKKKILEQQKCLWEKRLNRIKTVDSSLHTYMTLSANINCSNAIQSSWHFPK
jgi:hypothetical protein